MRYALSVAADIEASVGSLYKGFAETATDEAAAQFWRLLSYEEQTHRHTMELISSQLPDDFLMPEERLPAPLQNHLDGLMKSRRQVHSLLREKDMAADPFWQIRIASDLEKSEYDSVANWLMKLDVDPDIRAFIGDMTRGTLDHAERIEAYARRLERTVPEIAQK
ncbi:MAG TPA: hypothetical protein VGO93_19190 [Candidatus Xenobia bacterium]